MRKNKLIATMIAVGMIASVMTGCNTKTTNLSETEKIELLNEIKLYDVGGDKTLTKLEEMIDKNLESYTVEERDIMVNKYISQLYSNLGNLNNTLSVIGYELEDVVKEYKVDVTNPKTFKEIPDNHAVVRGFLQELNNKGFSLEKVGESKTFTIGLDSIALKDKYSKHVTKSLAKFLEFNAYETTSSKFADSEKRTIDLDEVAKRIVMIEDGLSADKEQGYKYLQNWLGASSYYYPILIGTSHDYFVSTEYLKDDILNKYIELAEKYKDKQLGKILNDIIAVYKENGKKADTDTLKKISDMAQKEIMTEEMQKVIKENTETPVLPTDTDTENKEEPQS